MSEGLHKIESKSGRAVSYHLGYIVIIIKPEAKSPSLLQAFFFAVFVALQKLEKLLNFWFFLYKMKYNAYIARE
ncbi:hypothetical protein COP00_05725 [Bacillus glycinifermentans]|uniref:Uncharacterized protein n=1 Tax=Bacillus glycinifermentans TaxID=1664069 RepID=A0A0T6BTF6_9BACI|nr:hypothetical protein COP00_05725 [Bacillus glycinifermentans]KRT94928.1 hypothetical protein AB447_210335 [Bacillus glycinifermentans]